MKYNPKKYMARLYALGEVFLRQAKEFDKSEHDGARRDDEMSRAFSGLADVEFAGRKIAKASPIRISFHSESDYYIYSLSKSLSLDLFKEFTADACVVFHDGKQFCERCIQSLNKGNNLGGWANDIRYFDPENITRDNLLRFTESYIINLCDQLKITRAQFICSPLNRSFIHEVWLQKPDSYQIQREYRIIAWLQEQYHQAPKYQKILLGDLSTISTLFFLDPSSGFAYEPDFNEICDFLGDPAD